MAETLVAEAAAPEGTDAPVEIPEYEVPDVPELAEEESPADEVADPYEGLTAEEIVAKAREGLVPAEEYEAKLREQGNLLRRKWETEAAERARIEAAERTIQQNAYYASAQGIQESTQRLVEAAENGELDDAFVNAEVQRMRAGASLAAISVAPQALHVYLQRLAIPNGLDALPPENQVAFHRARAEQDLPSMVVAAFEAGRAMQHPWTLRAMQEQSEAAKAAESQDTQAARKLQTERSGARAPVSPTGGRGSPGGNRPRTQVEAAQWFNDGRITAEQYNNYRRGDKPLPYQ